MKTYKTEGLVIGRRSLGEADRLLTIYTKHFGKKQLLAKGVRKISSRRAPFFELFSHISFLAYTGHAFDIITEVNALNQFKNVRERLGRIGHAYVVSELLGRFTAENQAYPEVYQLSIRYFQSLNQPVLGRNQAASALERYKFDLLSMLGFLDINVRETNHEIDRIIESILERALKSQALLARMY